jgi:hypothetical protein
MLLKRLFILFHIEQTPETPCMTSVQGNKSDENENESDHRLMTINEIINGSVSYFF